MNVSRTRCLVVWLTVTGAVTAVARWTLGGWEPATGSRPLDSFETLVPALAGVTLIVCAAWCWSVTTYVIVHALRQVTTGRPAPGAAPVTAPGAAPGAARGVPTWARSLVLTACGAALVGGALVGPAHATPGHIDVISSQTERDNGSGIAAVTGLPLPDRTTGPLRTERVSGGAPQDVDETTGAESITVRAGDSLWSIAERVLGPGATPAETAELVARLYDTNRAVIGAEPDLIFPGHQLRAPLGGRPYR